jgi:hypothetical protein
MQMSEPALQLTTGTRRTAMTSAGCRRVITRIVIAICAYGLLAAACVDADANSDIGLLAPPVSREDDCGREPGGCETQARESHQDCIAAARLLKGDAFRDAVRACHPEFHARRPSVLAGRGRGAGS